MKKLLALVLVLFLIGCGYRPLAHFAREIFGKSIYVEIIIDPKFPKSGVLAKDILNKAFLSRFHLDVTPKDKAQSKILMDLKSIDFTSIAQDDQGFTTHYKITVDIDFKYKSIYGEEYNVSTSGSSDYASTANMTSIATEKSQLDAINLAVEQAINKFVSQTFYQGATYLKKKINASH